MRKLARASAVCVIALTSTMGVTGCNHGSYVWVDDLSSELTEPEVDRLRAGDKVAVRVWSQETLSVECEVRPDGNITMPLVGDIAVGGLRLPDASTQIAGRLKGLVLDPRVSVSLVEGRPDFVTVLGEVNTVGRYPLEPGENILHLIGKAGGLTPFADPTRVFVIRRHATAQRVRFSYVRMANGESRGLEFPLRDGDVIVVE